MAALIKKPQTLHSSSSSSNNNNSGILKQHSKSGTANSNNTTNNNNDQSYDDSGRVSASDLRHASTETLLQTAAAVVEDVCFDSTIFNKRREGRFPQFQEREVVTGNVIGRGGFCVVRSVEKLKRSSSTMRQNNSNGGGVVEAEKKASSSSCLPWLCGGGGMNVEGDDSMRGFSNHSRNGKNHHLNHDMGEMNADDDDEEFDIRFTRDYVASMSRKRTAKQKKSLYVIKTVSTNVDKITYMKGCVDIALECKFLSTLEHPNIIQLIAVSAAEPCRPGYFLVLERMNETLHQRIKHWMDVDRHNKSVFGLFGGKNRELKLYREQIAAAYDISEALYYLHSKNVIFRDLKPDNIGFDNHNVLKLFDFGLAKELLDKHKDPETGLYRHMTKCTGAVRYMAPEVGLGRPYNLSADTYSWSMLLWFMLALEPPYGLYTPKMIFDRVFRRGARPAIFKRWREMISDIMKACWDADISQRPSFLEISLCLKQELIDCEEGGEMNGGSGSGGSTVQGNSYHGEDLNEQLSGNERMSSFNSSETKTRNEQHHRQ